MKSLNFEFQYTSHPDSSTLQKEDQELLEIAHQQLSKAYAPYSEFHVGAALRLENQAVTFGANQENASYSLCMCGERVAINNASVNHPGEKIITIAIVAKSKHLKINKPVTPCGACRQVICEFELKQDHPIRLLLQSDTDEVLEIPSAKSLLPIYFDGSFLGK